jgi:hypothetical protein
MPPKFRPRADGPPSASLLSGADGPPISPGDALLDDYSIRSPGVPSPVIALVLVPGSVPDDLAFHIMQWLLASATADADASTQDLLDARDARGRAASQELLLESERLSFRASLRGAAAGIRADDAAAFARDDATRCRLCSGRGPAIAIRYGLGHPSARRCSALFPSGRGQRAS